MFDVNKVLGQILDTPAKQGFAGGLAGGVLTGMLTSKSGRKLGKKAVQVGAIAAVGALAWNAWQKHQAAKAGAGTPAGASPGPAVPTASPAGAGSAVAEAAAPLALPPPSSGFGVAPEDVATANRLGLTLMRAMIAAARADGKLDGVESQAIFERLGQSDLTNEEKGLLMTEMSKPVDIDTLVADVKTPQEAAEVYVASLLAIEVDTSAEKAYLSLLAARLGLEEGLVTQLHAQVASA